MARRLNYGEEMLKTEHSTDECNWTRNMHLALTPPYSDERIKNLVEDGLYYEYNFGTFLLHPKVQEILKLNH